MTTSSCSITIVFNRAHHASRERSAPGWDFSYNRGEMMAPRKLKPYVKPPLTYTEQLDLLRGRGLIISNEDSAIEFLKSVNYYRFSGYRLTFRVDTKSERFQSGVTFEQVRGLYEFDQKLRHILMSILETVEISVRTRVAYELGHRYGPLGYKLSKNFTNAAYHAKFMCDLHKAIQRGDEIFITHHESRYAGRYPIWVAVELLSFGSVSQLFQNMIPNDQKLIANYYGVPPEYLRTWIHTAVYLRNVCAHHKRLYNKPLKVAPKRGRRWREVPHNGLLIAFLALREICPNSALWTEFVTQLNALIVQYTASLDLAKMGFTSDWLYLLQTGRRG